MSSTSQFFTVIATFNVMEHLQTLVSIIAYFTTAVNNHSLTSHYFVLCLKDYLMVKNYEMLSQVTLFIMLNKHLTESFAVFPITCFCVKLQTKF